MKTLRLVKFSIYQKGEFTSIDSAFEIAEDIIKTFNEYKKL
ncbi:hypothetical protein [Methanobrevibacter sp.]